ncbi:2',5'-phosphodiesterase 12 [Pelodytes ibericus]
MRLALRLLSGCLGSMERAVVRVQPSEPKLSITLVLSGSLRQMQREQSEPLGKALARIAASAARGPPKQQKSRGPEELPEVRLWYGGEPVPVESVNAEAWRDGAVLQVGELRYRVERNPPVCTELRLPRSAMPGFPVCPTLQLESARAEHCRFVWYRQQQAQSGDSPQSRAEDGWEEVGHQQVYTPVLSDLGFRLKLRVTPGDGLRLGESREQELGDPVEPSPECTWREYSQAQAPLTRAVSYNLLAEVYAQSEQARTVLFPYCPPRALEPGYRRCLIQRELRGYRADLLCLQEVDAAAYTESLEPALGEAGLDGLYRPKDQQREGLATFYRRSRFRLLSRHDIVLRTALREDPRHAALLERLARYPAARERVLNRNTALQVTVLQSTTEPVRHICVANIHLYFHPKGGNIRLIQLAVAFAHIRHVAYELYPGIPVIFCGDFNSTPSTGLYSFVKNGTISEDHEDWASNGEEEQCNMALKHSFNLESACGEPEYTNYVVGFNGCLDYIFIDSDRIEVEQVIPLPTHEEVTRYQALPSLSHPSDHLALVCDLKFK